MKKFEYKNFHEKPFIQLNPQQFADYILETLNKIGAQGWQAITVVTPQVLSPQGQQTLTGDLLILAMRELPPEAPKQATLDNYPHGAAGPDGFGN